MRNEECRRGRTLLDGGVELPRFFKRKKTQNECASLRETLWLAKQKSQNNAMHSERYFPASAFFFALSVL